ncbi:MAG: M10 family metallopeptidase domain-containing protein [Actinomycetota bacterium]|nr:M10 family metallopeptidase domain-containing protein [Actinomycetota bacterium]
MSVEVVTAPGVLAEPPGFTRPSILPWTPAPTLPQSTVPAAPDPGPSVPPGAGPGGGASSRRFSSSPHDYTLTGYQWKPCQPITVSSDGPDVSAIVAELASITGLSLQLVNGPANIMVGWGPMPIAHAIGVTEGTAYGTFFAHVTITLAPRGASSLPSLLRHELGHALGLGHTDQPNEIMYPVLRSDSPNDYQAGDRAGLQFIGTSATSC